MEAKSPLLQTAEQQQTTTARTTQQQQHRNNQVSPLRTSIHELARRHNSRKASSASVPCAPSGVRRGSSWLLVPTRGKPSFKNKNYEAKRSNHLCTKKLKKQTSRSGRLYSSTQSRGPV